MAQASSKAGCRLGAGEISGEYRTALMESTEQKDTANKAITAKLQAGCSYANQRC